MANYSRMFFISLGLIVLFHIMSPAAQADTVFTNFGAGFSYDINSGNPVGNAFDGNNYAEGDTFVPGANYNLSSLTIALSNVIGAPVTPITLSLTGSAGNQPGAVVESWSIAPGLLGPFGINNPPLIVNSILHPVLFSGAQYWLTLSTTKVNSLSWNLNSIGDAGDEAISADGGSSWFSPSGSTPGAYQVIGTPVSTTVPEPSSFVLLGAGLLALVYRKIYS